MKSIRELGLLLCIIMYLIFVNCDPVTKDCCWPDVFETVLGSNAGMPIDQTYGVNYVEHRAAFDFPGKVWGLQLRHIYVTGDYEEVIWIEDYENDRLTVASAVHGCKYAPIPLKRKMRKPCVPDDAAFVKTTTMGGDKKRISYDVWEWEAPGHTDNKYENYTMIMNAYVMRDTCLPLNEIGWYSEKNLKLNAYLGFHDITLGLGEDNMFEEVKKSYKCTGEETTGTGINFPFEGFPHVQALKEYSYLARRFLFKVEEE